jgi:hypothetical protein
VFDSDGNVTEIYGRKINRKLRRGTPDHTYLLRNGHNGDTPRGIWNSSALQDTDEVILCHSIVEALTWWSAGHRNVTAAYGYDGFTEEQIASFQHHNIQRVLLAYGNTAQGNAASAAVAEQLDAAGMGTTRIKYPMGHDANETASRSTCPRETLSALLANNNYVADASPEAAVAGGSPDPTATDDRRSLAPHMA